MKYFSMFVGLLSLMAVSCSIDRTDLTDSAVPEPEDVFYVTIGEQPDADTKVYTDESLHIKWNAGDRFTIFNKKTYNREFCFKGQDGDTSGTIEAVESDGPGETLDRIYAVYPYSESTDISTSGTITYTLPAEQSYRAGSFGIDANVMVSVTDNTRLHFKNAGGYLSMKFYGEGISVSSITLKGNDGELLSGPCTISTSGEVPVLTMSQGAGNQVTMACDPPVTLGATASSAVQFIFVLPPVTFAKGLTVTVTTSEGNVFKKSTYKACTIDRSNIKLFAALEVVPHEPYYSSTDYSRDGEVVQLQQAAEGRGINLIFMGDGFVDTDMADGGRYDCKMEEAMEQFFAYEPYTTFRDRFNVYAVRVVSENAEYTDDSDRRLTYYKTEGMAMRVSVCQEYARLVPNPNNQPLKIGVIANTEERVYRSVCAMFSDGRGVGFIFDAIGNVLNHEIGGHGFAGLFDEYVEKKDETFTDTASLDDMYSSSGWGANVDWRNNLSTVRWSRFLSDELYEAEGLGIYEGAYLYGSGIFRATENSMMRYNDTPFNAPSREQIYKTIMKYSEGDEWVYDYEAFVDADAAGRMQAAAAFSSKAASPSMLRVPPRSELPLPPVLIDQDVKVVIVDGKGGASVIR